MTKEQVIAMAQICGDWNGETVEMNDVGIEHFATLVGNAKLEQAAQTCEAQLETGAHIRCAQAIRNLKEPTT